MNFNKLFLRWIAGFGLAMIFAVSGWGDIEPNDTNATAELNATFNNLTNDVSGILSGQILKTDADDDDYYKINTTNGKAGTVDVNLTSDSEIDLTIIRCNDNNTSCTTVYNYDAPPNYLNHLTSFDMDINQTAYFKLHQAKNANTYYGLGLKFSGLKISVGNALIREWDTGITGMSFPIILTSNSTVPITITYLFNDIDTNGSDTNMTSGSLYSFILDENLSRGTHQILLLGIVGDTIQETNETFKITLQSVSNGVLDLTNDEGIGTIWDDDGANTPAPAPTRANFSVVESGLYDVAAGANKYYNLTTQASKRHGNYKIVSFDTNSSLYNIPKNISADVGVDVIDLDTGDCDTAQQVAPRIWMHFDNNVSQINFNQTTTQAAIAAGEVSDFAGAGAISVTTPAEYFRKAVKNATFRVSSLLTNDGDSDLVKSELQPSGKRTILNFPQLVQNIGTCMDPVRHPSHLDPADTTTTERVAVACGNAGNQGITPVHYAICMECLFGYNNQKVCSRDNFSIRPESYNVALKDMNQTTQATFQPFATGQTGVTNPVASNVNMASGYDYYFDINATDHLSNNAVVDYNRTFSAVANDDFNISFNWQPSLSATDCDDNESKPMNFALIDGTIPSSPVSLHLGKVSQVGQYTLSIKDKTWTAVDWNSSLYQRSPVVVVPSSYYLNTTDCQNTGVSTVPTQANNIVTIAGGNYLGCMTQSYHDNLENGLKYRDYNVTFHPYKFDMNTIKFGVGIQPQEINATSGSDFVYMSDMSRNDSMNMSLRATGNITAKGYDDSNLSNFVDNCYAKNINLTMNSDANLTIPGVPFQYRFQRVNSTDDINATMTAPQFVTLLDGNFTADMNGSLSMVTRFNFDRNQTTPVDPKTVQYTDFKTGCEPASVCTMQADLSASHEAIGSKAMNFNLTHVYGRIIPRDIRVFGSVPFAASAWYEVFNAPSINGTSLPASRNDANWYTNTLHADLNDGDGNVTVIIPTTPLSLPIHTSSTTGIETYQFNAIPLADIPYGGKAHINTDPWLWYGINALEYLDPVNATNLDCLTHPCFNINVVPAIGATGSAKTGAESKKASKKSTSEAGAGGWKSTSDYAPAIR